MSGDPYTEPGIINHVYCDPDDKVNIYVSAESLKVYDNPWVEGTNRPGPAEAQHPVIPGNSGKRSHVRTDSVILGLVCLLLLAGIIYIGVRMNKDKTSWTRERNQLQKDYASLKKTSEQLKANNTELRRERNYLWDKFCRQKPKKCRKDPGRA